MSNEEKKENVELQAPASAVLVLDFFKAFLHLFHHSFEP